MGSKREEVFGGVDWVEGVLQGLFFRCSLQGEEEKDRTTGQAKEEFILPQNTVEANTVDKGQTSLLSNILEAEPTSGSEAAPQPEDNKIWWTENIEEAIADLR